MTNTAQSAGKSLRLHPLLKSGPCHVLAICSGNSLLSEPKGAFEERGIVLTEVCSEADALLRIGRGDVQAVLVDSRLQAIPAPDVVAAIHKFSDLPILVAVDGTDAGHRVGYDSLSQGARGLIASPVDIDALARALASAGYRPLRDPSIMEYGEIELDPDAMTFSFPGGHIDLTPRELEVARILLTAAPDIVSAEDLEGIWAGVGTRHRNARMAVVRIRQKLSLALPGSEQILQTVRGRGYRFIA